MKIRNLLLASSAVAAIAAVSPAQAGPFYISVLGGVNWLEDERIFTTNSTTANHDFDTGFFLGGAFGLHLDQWAKGLKVELEAAYRRNENDGRFTSFSFSTGTIHGHQSTFSLMANAWYEFDVGSKFRPYVGGGVGWARNRNEQFWITSGGSATYLTTTGDNAGFAWQAGLGFNYEIMRGVDLGLGYRYFDGPNIAAFNGCCGPDNIDNVNHTVAVNLSIDID